MKAEELRGMAEGALKEKLEELHQQAMNMRFQQAVGQMENTSQVRNVRRDIARIRTILGERARSGQEG
ncbi:MAG: 50S ribosomal protein L29 [Magnetococcales bacterium]|nr:50S ribosomal protein L29 [Magnetococcales bacterium]